MHTTSMPMDNTKSIDYCPTKKINFTSARGRKRKLDELIDGEGTRIQECDMPLVPHGDVATDTDMAMLFENLSLGGTCPAVFSVLPDYSDPFVPKIMLLNFPKPLMSLRQPEYANLRYDELLALCESPILEITKCLRLLKGKLGYKVSHDYGTHLELEGLRHPE